MYPEDFSHMRPIVAKNMIDEFDTNHDGYVDINEYLHVHLDLDEDEWNPDNEKYPEDVIETEKSMFTDSYDLDKNGLLDESEIIEWMFPNSNDHKESEVEHLFGHADEDQDGLLSYEEILHKYDVFIESPATDYGEALFYHDDSGTYGFAE